ncbi:MAG TPA: hypothetical protein VFW50_14700 [Streptosporangiaceae bacterium]|nr:hypothetical protein [Streptosporangiaceae bacterium]
MPATTTHPGWTYRSVFARDGYETFTGLLADGDLSDARAMVRLLFDRTQQPDGSFPRDPLIDGAVAPDTFGLSEIDFVVSHGPAFGVERREEHPGYSPSTLAAEIAGLVAASRLAAAAGDSARAPHRGQRHGSGRARLRPAAAGAM